MAEPELVQALRHKYENSKTCLMGATHCLAAGKRYGVLIVFGSPPRILAYLPPESTRSGAILILCAFSYKCLTKLDTNLTPNASQEFYDGSRHE